MIVNKRLAVFPVAVSLPVQVNGVATAFARATAVATTMVPERTLQTNGREVAKDSQKSLLSRRFVSLWVGSVCSVNPA